MAKFRHNKTEDDYEIITTAEGTQKIAEELAKLGGVVEAKASTTNATPEVIFALTLPLDSAVVVMADIAGTQTNGDGRLGYRRRAMAYRLGAGAVLQGGVNTPMSKSGGGAVWDATIDVNGNDVRVVVTGEAAKDIEWTARVEVTVAQP
jgi:hypothetical protein